MFKKITILFAFLILFARLGFCASSFVPDQASDIQTSTTNFGGTLSSADNTVQKALDTIDDAIAGAGSGDVTSVGDCSTGACLDGTSDGGTNILFYDAQGATTLQVGDNSGAVTLTLPITTGTLIYSGGAFHDGFSDFVANEHIDWTQDQGATNIHAGNYTDTNTNASTICSGTTTYLDGEGNCDDISSVYEAADTNIIKVGEIDTFSELDAIVADKALVNKADGAVWSGVHDFGGATSLEIPNGNDPDVDAEGETSWDANNDALRVFDGTNQPVVGSAEKHLVFSITKPKNLDDAATQPLWTNETPWAFIITAIYSKSSSDDVDFTLKEVGGENWSDISTIEAIQVSSNGTGVYYTDTTSGIDDTSIAAGNTIVYDNDATDDPNWVLIDIKGYFNADVN